MQHSQFEDGFNVIVRFPILGRSRFRVEKTNDELLVMQYLTNGMFWLCLAARKNFMFDDFTGPFR